MFKGLQFMEICPMLQNDQSEDIFYLQLIDIGNGKFPIRTGCISFPESFCLNTARNYLFHDWLSERIILIARNLIEFQNSEDEKPLDTATKEDDVVNH